MINSHTIDEKKFKIDRFFSFAILIMGMVLIDTIPLPNTIAIRNICLYLGAFFSIYFIYSEINEKNASLLTIPAIIFLIILWVIFLYFYHPTIQSQQLIELKSLWPRSFAATIFGVGLAVILIRKVHLAKIFFINYFVLALVNLISCLIEIYHAKTIPVVDYFGIFITKAPATYFLIFPFLITIGYLDSLIMRFSNLKNIFPRIITTLVILIFCIFSQYLMQSLNGLLIAFAVLLIQAGLFLTTQTKIKIRDRLILVLSALIIIAGFSYVYSTQNNKLKNIILDAQVGLQINEYPQWRYDSRDSGLPIVVDERTVNGSTFYRVASIKKGLEIIAINPAGAGFTFLPYGYYLKLEYPNARSDHTHSGWIDYTLGVGIPGMLLTLLAILYGLHHAVSNRFNQVGNADHQILNSISMWVLLGLTLLWTILEVSEKEYIEYLFFSISLFGSIAYIIHEQQQYD
ncbi:O-antigen ligase family protein [Polynucleobacter sp. AP-Titi-500A-B4]|uniref:O-antigen ligase family protein n=1 Tax=Polynucleobacter sp. AP-Titi-500A-B4 TaxID=2576923 RepID=UPI001BFEDEB7|nr:O-antigen ligase family protein [Polynucleobacter sp. AP-Titi-500A-B4]QWE12831.1 O-antigen ligase family protein [Polynucleobacter sp. AP-Titi-500A-B4]